jgi:hypothetical protein
MAEYQLDQDAVDAALDLFHRCGARQTQFGYLDDEAANDWYAWVEFHNGEKIMASGKPGPLEALETLARRLLNGAKCTHCLQVTTLTGTARYGICRWTRHGDKWVRGCVDINPDKQLHVKAKDFAPGSAS